MHVVAALILLASLGNLDIGRVVRYGCFINQQQTDHYDGAGKFKGTTSEYETWVWAQYSGGDSECSQKPKGADERDPLCYGKVEGRRDKRKLAYQDCSHWMDEVKKALEKRK